MAWTAVDAALEPAARRRLLSGSPSSDQATPTGEAG
jgi:hypothetical protein